METLAAFAPAMAEIDILMDVGLVKINQPMLIALSAVQRGMQLLDESLASLGLGAAEQLSGFFP